MNRLLSQAIKIPGPEDTPIPINYTDQFKGFKFASSSVGDIVSRAIPFVFAFAGIGLLFMIISAGFTLLTSAGDSKKTEAGKQRLTQAVVGFLIIFASYWAVQAAGFILGLDEIKAIFK